MGLSGEIHGEGRRKTQLHNHVPASRYEIITSTLKQKVSVGTQAGGKHAFGVPGTTYSFLTCRFTLLCPALVLQVLCYVAAPC